MELILYYCIPLALLAWLGSREKMRGYLLCRVFLVLFLSILSAVTSPVASDHLNYVAVYDDMQGSTSNDITLSLLGYNRAYGLEPGYLLLNLILGKLGCSEAMFFFICALLINGPVIWFIYRHKLPVLAILYIFIGGGQLIFQQNLLRQFIAGSIFLIALSYLTKFKPIHYTVLIFCAAFFHYSALFMIPLVLLGIKWNERGKIKKLSVFGYNAIMVMYFVSIVSIFFPGLILGLLNFMHVDSYGQFMDAKASVGMKADMIYLLLYNIFALGALYTWKNVNKPLAVCTIALSFFYNCSVSVPSIMRMTVYFIVPSIVFLFHYLLSSSTYKDKSMKSFAYSSRSVFIMYILYLAFVNFVLTDTILFSKYYTIVDFL